jgi:hypothetical protein
MSNFCQLFSDQGDEQKWFRLTENKIAAADVLIPHGKEKT